MYAKYHTLVHKWIPHVWNISNSCTQMNPSFMENTTLLYTNEYKSVVFSIHEVFICVQECGIFHTWGIHFCTRMWYISCMRNSFVYKSVVFSIHVINPSCMKYTTLLYTNEYLMYEIYHTLVHKWIPRVWKIPHSCTQMNPSCMKYTILLYTNEYRVHGKYTRVWYISYMRYSFVYKSVVYFMHEGFICVQECCIFHAWGINL
jgi:1,2-phenylacetyl-CoA epoxidase PaaB subunit